MDNPNIRFNSIVQEMKCCFGINDIFAVYYDKNNNNELYLIFPSENYSIKITRLIDNHFIKSLEGHQNQISFVKHFYNNIAQKDHLISSDKSCVVIVWDLSNNYNLLFSLKINYSKNSIIYNCTAFFSGICRAIGLPIRAARAAFCCANTRHLCDLIIWLNLRTFWLLHERRDEMPFVSGYRSHYVVVTAVDYGKTVLSGLCGELRVGLLDLPDLKSAPRIVLISGHKALKSLFDCRFLNV